jgi:hypothetical protein
MADLVFRGKGKMFDIWIPIPHIKDCTSQKSLHKDNLTNKFSFQLFF